MVKSLSVTIEDINKDNGITISGSLDEDKFNETIVITVGSSKVALNSKELAHALAEIVNFQTVKPPLTTRQLYDGVETK